MAKQKYNLKCVNNSKPFEMPVWTPEKHEKALAKLDAAQEKNNWDEKRANTEFMHFVIHETLIEIDPECDIEAIRKLHPATKVELYHEVYNAGREDIYYRDFRKGKTPKDKK